MTGKPKVSILCLTYNQKSYINQCLDSFLMQKTNFDIEILINDDASTDGTVDILKEYSNKYPKLIRLNLQKENQYSQGKRNFFIRYLLPKAKGKYIALCEGDDYWTDSNKLQKQVDYLEKNPDYSICFHPVEVKYENHKRKTEIFPKTKEKFTVDALLRSNFIQTNSVMYRKQKYENMNNTVMPGDWYLHLYHARYGKIGFIDSTMSVYRRHEDSLWWSAGTNRDTFWLNYGIRHMSLYTVLIKMFDNPEQIKIVISNMEDAINGTIPVVEKLIEENNTTKRQLANLRQVHNLVINSKTWKLRNQIRRVLRRNE